MLKRISLRFNPDKETDKAVWEYLQSLDKEKHKSINRFIISSVYDRIKAEQRNTNESALIDKMIAAIRQELRQSFAGGLLQLMNIPGQVSTPADANTDSDDDAALDFASGSF